ncbi:hypothetical protein ABEH87_03950 [Erwinia sp. Eh17-17]|jgi:hypothetical protein|uniref:hypothetical protein n=1 Tax=Erwinia sp. Eh17-17 TaxID=3080330 RepID=UPI003207ABAD
MNYGIKSNAIRVAIFMVCAVLMVVGYQTLHEWYAKHYQIVSHRSVGLRFVAFYFYYLALPALFIIAFIPWRWGSVVYLSVMGVLLFLWFPYHPLRVTGMAACTTGSYLLLNALKWKCRV